MRIRTRMYFNIQWNYITCQLSIEVLKNFKYLNIYLINPSIVNIKHTGLLPRDDNCFFFLTQRSRKILQSKQNFLNRWFNIRERTTKQIQKILCCTTFFLIIKPHSNLQSFLTNWKLNEIDLGNLTKTLRKFKSICCSPPHILTFSKL